MAIGDNTKRNVKHITDKHKAKPTATMKYQGALLIPIEITPRPQTQTLMQLDMYAIDNLHCTIMLPKDLKPLKDAHGFTNKELKAMLKNFVATHPAPPIPQLGAKIHTAYRLREDDDLEVHIQRTNFLRVLNQQEMQAYLDTITDALGLPKSERFFHVSIANQTGKANESVSDISRDDCTYGDDEE